MTSSRTVAANNWTNSLAIEPQVGHHCSPCEAKNVWQQLSLGWEDERNDRIWKGSICFNRHHS